MADLNHYVAEVADAIREGFRSDSVSPGVVGWQNTNKPGRVGTTGSAVPLLFFAEIGMPSGDGDGVRHALRERQFPDGGWPILSAIGSSATEGTAWCLHALAATGDVADREAVTRAEQWLLLAQRVDGGWGSLPGGEGRTTMTVAALGALDAVSPASRSPIRSGLQWLRNAQNADGSWGPIVRSAGTLAHTASVVNCMAALAPAECAEAIDKALGFLEARWHPDPALLLVEEYDIHIGANAHKVRLEHDVDALMLRLLFMVPEARHIASPWEVAGGILRGRPLDSFWDSHHVRPSQWNMVPRALAINFAAKHLPVAPPGDVRWFGDVSVLRSSATLAARFALIRVAASEFAVTRRSLRILIAVVLVVLFVWLTALLITGGLPAVVYLTSVVLTGLFGVLSLLGPSRD